ncbi:MAG: TIGR02221 family CRISPR-associated protein [Chthonomonadales bacterium]
MRLLTVLGTGDYKPADYWWNGSFYNTALFPEALVHWLKPAEVCVFLTEEAEAHENWRKLQERLQGRTQYTSVRIPSCKSEDEMWRFFEVLAEHVNGEEVVLDITHGFRSLPMLALLAIAFLRIAQNLRKVRILYGAFEAKDQNGRVPVFELTGFVELLEWASAANQFLDTGDAGRIAQLLEDKHNGAYKARPRLPSDRLPKGLKKFADALRQVSSAEATAQPQKVCAGAANVMTQLERVETEARSLAPPMALLMQRIRNQYARLALSDENQVSREALDRHLSLVETYQRRGQVTQGLLSAREWVVSVACWALETDWLDSNARDGIATAINKLSRKRTRADDDDQGKLQQSNEEQARLERLRGLAWFEHLLRAWDKVGQVRNSLAHCGMRTDAKDPSVLQRELDDAVPLLIELAIASGVRSAG